MKFPSAQKGVSKLYVAALIGIIATAFVFVGAILSGFADGSEGLKAATGGVVGVGGIAGLVVFVLELVGLHQASEDTLAITLAKPAMVLQTSLLNAPIIPPTTLTTKPKIMIRKAVWKLLSFSLA